MLIPHLLSRMHPEASNKHIDNYAVNSRYISYFFAIPATTVANMENLLRTGNNKLVRSPNNPSSSYVDCEQQDGRSDTFPDRLWIMVVAARSASSFLVKCAFFGHVNSVGVRIIPVRPMSKALRTNESGQCWNTFFHPPWSTSEIWNIYDPNYICFFASLAQETMPIVVHPKSTKTMK